MIILVLFILGLCFGSFVNALVWRLRMQGEQSLAITKKSKKSKNQLLTTSKYSILNGRSMCPNCKHELAWHDLIPLFSWLLLKGKCRYCKKPISIQYPIVELMLGLVFVWSYLAWSDDLTTSAGVYSLVVWLIASVGLMALAVYDYKWMQLPTIISYSLIIFTVISRVIYIVYFEQNIKSALLNWALALAISSGLFFVLYMVSKGKWIGDGDITLGVILGTLLASPWLSFLMIFTASVLALIFSLPSILSSKSKLKKQIPFGPFLILGTFLVLLYGQPLIDWYKKLLLIE